MPAAGYSCLVRKSGVTTAITAEACSLVTGSVTFQITTAARRVIDPTVNFNFQDGGATIAYTGISSLDYLNGRVVFSAPPTGAVTFNGSFLPITTSSDLILESRSFNLGQSVDLLDTTVFTGSSTDYVHKRIPALKDVSLDVESIATRADLATLTSAQFAGAPMVTEVFFGDATIPRFRGFMQVEDVGTTAAVDGLLTTNITFKAAAILNETANKVAGFTFLAQP